MDPTFDERADLEQQIEDWRKRWYRGQRAWSVAHHGALFGASVLSAAVGSIVQVGGETIVGLPAKALSTLMAFVAASLAAIAGAGGFDRKWRANRLSRGTLDGLLIDLRNPHSNTSQIRSKLKETIRLHDEEILGAVERGVSGTGG
jgi:hypothetical protein